MKARNKQPVGKKPKDPKRLNQDLSENRENLGHRIKALKKIIEQLKDEKNK